MAGFFVCVIPGEQREALRGKGIQVMQFAQV
jgi:hypothetical protein